MQNAKEAVMSMKEEVNMQQNNYQAHVEAARVAELEAAQAAAQAALMAEMDLLRRQKHGAEQHSRDLEEQVWLVLMTLCAYWQNCICNHVTGVCCTYPAHMHAHAVLVKHVLTSLHCPHPGHVQATSMSSHMNS